MIASIMFHYFHDDITYLKCQGSLSEQDLEKIITTSKYKIISVDEWFNKYETNRLSSNEVFLSFDDGLKEQIKIALPVLERHNLKGLYAINTKAILSGRDKLELYRHFRNNYFKDVNDFYVKFFDAITKTKWVDTYNRICTELNFEEYLQEYSFYTYDDRKFRYFRDQILKEDYDEVMDLLILNSDLDPDNLDLWFSLQDIRMISKNGHQIALHTHTHPYNFDKLSEETQYQELSLNKIILQDIISKFVNIVSYPCGRYNEDTIKVLGKLNIDYAVLSAPSNNSERYRLGRIDCADILRYLS